jgi:hypothetical protein
MQPAIRITVAEEMAIWKAERSTTRDAEAAARYQASAMWILFGSTLLGAVAAAAGSWLVEGHIGRLYDRR